MKRDGAMTESELSALQALCDAATPGEWVRNETWGLVDAGCIVETATARGDPRLRIATLSGAGIEADAAFIAAARTALPALIAEVRRLRKNHESTGLYVDGGACEARFALTALGNESVSEADWIAGYREWRRKQSENR